MFHFLPSKNIWVTLLIHALKASKPNTNIYKLSWLTKDITEGSKWIWEYPLHRASLSPPEFNILVTASNNLPVVYSGSKNKAELSTWKPHNVCVAHSYSFLHMLFMLCCYTSNLKHFESSGLVIFFSITKRKQRKQGKWLCQRSVVELEIKVRKDWL